MQGKNTIYYNDELNDEFSSAKINPIKIDKNYKYKKNSLWNICSLIVQNILSMPIKIGYSKIKFKIKYIGKEKLKKYKKQGYFVYVNHTQAFADTFIPSIAIYPKRNFLIVNPENISIKYAKNIIEMLGAIPVPGDKESMKNFLETIKEHIQKNHSITIYPEAHIWPYYTKIRPFKSVSFAYPIDLDTPTFSMTNTYQSYGKNNNKIKIVTYIDGPFFANGELSKKEQKKELRDIVYNCMVERSKNSNIEHIKYIKKERFKLKKYKLEGGIKMSEIKFEIIEELGILSEKENGWKKELNLISWNDREPKYDLRDWSENHEKMGKGITLSKEEINKLKEIIDKNL